MPSEEDPEPPAAGHGVEDDGAAPQEVPSERHHSTSRKNSHREKDKARDRDRDRDKHRHKDKSRKRERDKEAPDDRHKDGSGKERRRERDRDDRSKPDEPSGNHEQDRSRDRDRDRDRGTERDRHKDRDRHRDRDRHGDRDGGRGDAGRSRDHTVIGKRASHERRDDERSARDSKRARRTSPDLEDGQLPAPPGGGDAMDTDAAGTRSPRSQEARRERKREERKQKKEQEDKAAGSAAEQFDMSAGLTAEEIAMMQSLGLPFGFQTSAGAHVEDDAANEGGFKVSSQRKPRQYMNRKGGFNRSLPAERTGEKMQQV